MHGSVHPRTLQPDKRKHHSILFYQTGETRFWYAQVQMLTFLLVALPSDERCPSQAKHACAAHSLVTLVQARKGCFREQLTLAVSCTGAGPAGSSPVPPAAAVALEPPLTLSAGHSATSVVSWAVGEMRSLSVRE